jgi:hypothetical protein
MLDRLPTEICNLIYKQYIFSTEDLLIAIIKNDTKSFIEILQILKSSYPKNRNGNDLAVIDWERALIEATYTGNLEIIKLVVNNGALNLSAAYHVATYKKYDNYDNTTDIYIKITEYLYSVMYEEDGEMWDRSLLTHFSG